MKRLALVGFLLGWGARGVYETWVEIECARLEIERAVVRMQQLFAATTRTAAGS